MQNNFNKAFTLIELLISISILTVLMTISVFNYGTFNDNLALSSAGQEIAITIRQAQSYGLNVRENKVGGGDFNSAYGIYFNPVTNPSDYYVFIDSNGNRKYDVGNGCGSLSTECIQKESLRNGVIISSIDSNSGCPGASAARNLHITFLRPNPDAIITFINNGGATVCSSELEAKITLTSPKNKTLTITVDKTGQVSVQ